MNKKLIIYIIGLIVLIGIIAIVLGKKAPAKTDNSIINNNITIENTNTNTETNEVISIDTTNSMQEQIPEIKKENIDMIKIKVNNNVLEIKLENNEATKSLVERLKNGDISVNANEYGGFEKVGDLGFSLPRNDKSITTSAGDIVLYQGNQISLFYNSNSWSYTKLGSIQNVSSNELKSILGSGDVTLVLSLD